MGVPFFLASGAEPDGATPGITEYALPAWTLCWQLNSAEGHGLARHPG